MCIYIYIHVYIVYTVLLVSETGSRLSKSQQSQFLVPVQRKQPFQPPRREVAAYRSPPGQWEFSRRGPAQPLCLEFVQAVVRLSWGKGSMVFYGFVVISFVCIMFVLTGRRLLVGSCPRCNPEVNHKEGDV